MSTSRTLLVTGSAGLIGSETCAHFSKLGWAVHGIDNNMRCRLFGPGGDTSANLERLRAAAERYQHHYLDTRDREGLFKLFEKIRPDAVVHAAAQPSHDLAAKMPFEDFDINAVATLNLLEATRRNAAHAPFVFLSTNKVYGDRPNQLALRETATRWEYVDPEFAAGISESFSIDQCQHSLFGASKLAADIMVQEYGRYFGLQTCCLRGGCLTGPNHSGVELHGFLNYLVRCNLESRCYRIQGFKGKQVRDNLHAYDVARFIEEFVAAPRIAEVYNLGGGKTNTCSILEAFELVQAETGRPMLHEYIDSPRIGDHICYYSDLRKIQTHYPRWEVTQSLGVIIHQIAKGAIAL